MGSVGISFGSPTSGQGFDVTTTVAAIVANLQAVETPWKSQLTTLQSEDTALTGIGTDLSSLSKALTALTDFQGVLAEKEGSSSDNTVVTLTNATSAAVAGSHTIVVGQLAQTYSYASTSGAIGADDTLTGSLTINNQQITLSDGTGVDPTSGDTIPQNDTLATLAAYINDGDYGVQANVVTDSSGDNQLALVSDTSGAGGSVSIDGSALADATTGVTGFTFAQAQQGQDAEFSVDGLQTTSSSNTVTNAIPGVSMQLLDAAPGESVQIEITNDNTDVESAVNSFVSAYNTVIGDLNTQEGDTSSGATEPLYGSSTMALLQEQLQQAVIFTQSSGAVTSLSQLGITANDDGTLTLDTSTLDSVLNSNYQDVTNFFQAESSYTSFGANLTSTLTGLGNSGPDGAIYLALQQDSTQESDLNTNITSENSTISTEQTQLTTELNEANYTLEEIPTELQSVSELYSAITGYDENPEG